MTVKELKEILDKYPDNYKVYVWADHGQNFESLSDYCAGSIINSYTIWIPFMCEECGNLDFEIPKEDRALFGSEHCNRCRYHGLKEDSLVLYGE